jgi:SAM-dependent methyltransferase
VTATATNFAKYSEYYDLLYRDKDYASEAAYVAQTIRAALPAAHRILELGSGTGRHGRLLAGMGFEVHGIERSPEMVSIARCADAGMTANGSFTCEVGDIRTTRLGRAFDAVISLFHVISYQTTNRDLQAAFEVAAAHLVPGGVFLFDVWHGPAVLCEGPTRRTKVVSSEQLRVKRTASPDLDTNRGTVNVVFEMECEDMSTRDVVRFEEKHSMRYLFATEIDFLAQMSGLSTVKTEEFLTGHPPSRSTWGVAYLLRK